VNPFEFLDELFIAKTRVLVLSAGEDVDSVPVVTDTDTRTDGQTDNPTVANTGSA